MIEHITDVEEVLLESVKIVERAKTELLDEDCYTSEDRFEVKQIAEACQNALKSAYASARMFSNKFGY